jgi:tagatose 1,6-diphosphate aldolase
VLFSRPFQFLDHGPLIDRELELVQPHERWVEPLLAACAHPLTQRDMPQEAEQTTRRRLMEFLDAAPLGRQPADPARGRVPAYHFWMRVDEGFNLSVTIAGGIGLRVGRTRDLEMFAGQIGYHVYPPARGHHYAERACRLLMPLARAHGLSPIWITCNPDNAPSRRTIERLGGELIDTVPIPKDHEFYSRGEREKCRYRLRPDGLVLIV